MTSSNFRFRIWDRVKEEMLYPRMDSLDGLYVSLFDTFIYEKLPGGVMRCLGDLSNCRYRIGSSTERYDCDGTEIWEGDFIGNNTPFDKGATFMPNRLVMFERDSFMGLTITKEPVSSLDPLKEILSIGGWRVIGNRFQNPELFRWREKK